MAKIVRELKLEGKSANQLCTELNLPLNFLSDVLLEHNPRTYGELIDILQTEYKRELISIKQNSFNQGMPS